MEYLDFLYGKPSKGITGPTPVSRSHVPQDMSAFKEEMQKPKHERAYNNAGYSYVAEYRQEEERRMLQEEEQQSLYANMDSISINTDDEQRRPVIDDSHLYRTYDLNYRPKHKLSITQYRSKLMDLIVRNPVVIVHGPTGCGKTTQVPQFILDQCSQKKQHCNIIVTQPRRIAAVSIAKRVCSERDWPLGSIVGYRIGMVSNVSDDTRITYCTTGVLLRRLITNKHMLDFTHIILDEVHERDQDMDFLLLIVRKFLRSNSRNVKVILMSATMNSDKFSKYFSTLSEDRLLKPAPTLQIGKDSIYHVKDFYLDHLKRLNVTLPTVDFDEPKITSEMLNLCAALLAILDDIDAGDHKSSGAEGPCDRHVALVFLPGIWEIEELFSVMMAKKYENIDWDVVVLHSTVTNEEQQKIFDPPPHGHRRVILSTNIAESSLTVPNVKYVIDFCLTKVLVTDPSTNYNCLELCWASKSNCEQRAGRTGRVMDGKVYRLVPEHMYQSKFMDEGSPEMLRAPLEHLVLNAKLLDMGEPKALLALALDPPDISNLENTILLLKEVGALLNRPDGHSPHDGELTSLGRMMANLPVDIHISKLIALGHTFGILRSAIIVGASMATKNMFNNPFNEKMAAYNAKLNWSKGSWSDCATYLQVYQFWQEKKASRSINSIEGEKKWAQRHFIQLKVLYDISAMVKDLEMRLEHMGIVSPTGQNLDVTRSNMDGLMLKVIIGGAFYPHYFASRRANDDDGLATAKLLGGHDSLTTVFFRDWPLKLPGKLYAKRVQQALVERGVVTSWDRVKVNFENSSRVYVTFSQGDQLRAFNTNKDKNDVVYDGRVPLAVYKALRLKRSDQTVPIPVMTTDKSEEKSRELGLPCNESLMWAIMSDNQDQDEAKKKLRPILPSLDTSHLNISITHVINPGHFWAQIKDEDTDRKRKWIEYVSNNEDMTKPIKKAPCIGDLVITPYCYSNVVQYYRGIVESFFLDRNEKHARVLLIDYGCTTEVKISELYEYAECEELLEMAEKFFLPVPAALPALAFECILCGIKPSPLRNVTGLWTSTALEDFTAVIYNEDLFAEVYSVVDSVVSLNLFCIQGQRKKSVNEYMIEKGHAQKRAESYFSKKNHEARQVEQEMGTSQRQAIEESQYVTDLSHTYPEPPDLSECEKVVYLKGPYSPLEVELSHLVCRGSSKRVTIDSSSINAVLLDPNPEESEQFLVVAASVSQNVHGTNLSLRNTTLMPNIKGLTSLMSLIFAPRIELKRNERFNKYVGALCGLGFDSLTKRSIFPEHDMGVTFDVEITDNDLIEINRLRHFMNVSMMNNIRDRDNVEETKKRQANCRSKLFSILVKTRKPIVVKHVPYHLEWGTVHESDILRPKNVTDIIVNNIYPLHCALQKEVINEEHEAMLDHLDDLQSMLLQDPKEKNETIECQLCEVSFFGIMELRRHICTEQHNELLKKFTDPIG